MDLLPTILGYCGLDIPTALPGLGLHDYIEGGRAPERDGIAVEYHSHVWGEPLLSLRAWRTDGWKYVETLDGDNELYDLLKDPKETCNLYASEKARSTGNRMKAALERWLVESADSWPRVPVAGEKHEMKTGEWERLAHNIQ